MQNVGFSSNPTLMIRVFNHILGPIHAALQDGSLLKTGRRSLKTPAADLEVCKVAQEVYRSLTRNKISF